MLGLPPAVGGESPSDADTLPIRDVLRQAAAAVDRFGRDLVGVVARERYLQTTRTWPGHPPSADGAGRVLEQRVLVSSLLLVYDPATPWQLHRDVLSIDGQPVPDGDRLRQALVEQRRDARQALRAITDASARFNLGHVARNINVPTFPLIALHAEHQGRFRFRDGGRPTPAHAVRRLTFTERGRPRVIRGAQGRDVRLDGEVHLDHTTGEVVRAILSPRSGRLQSRLEVIFDTVDGVGRVPVRFWEWYRVDEPDSRATYVEGVAVYDDFRRYTTDTRVLPR